MTETSENTLLHIQDLSVQYATEEGAVSAVTRLNLALGPGESLGLVGETGAGKTTTALSVLRLLPKPQGQVTRGRILFNGADLLQKTEDEMRAIRGEEIAMIFQDPMTSLNPVMPVNRQISEMISLHQDLSDAEALKKAGDMLELAGIRRERGGEYPHQFSGGMRQRVVIAIALACNPRLLIADEPTTALDVTIQAQVLKLMRNLKQKFNTSLIMITHDLGIVAEMCDRVSIMYAGRVVEHAPTQKLFENHRHPYTEGLFNSLPSLDEEQDRLQVIKGQMPDPMDLPSGCCFHPRCPYAMDRCSREEPPMSEAAPGHFCACHALGREGESR